ncbi:peptidoglycan-binding protein [Streptomyces venezuelae]|uniref:Peptidoglycan-binding protein n=1 Tax=Streptomyces venezuelae TaxID=54571 RepID=A0A5P2D1I5_STRVZ|nr:helix-turn-helix domain-containing protein [Streptomyces venezuelae]QES48067.1 peptidoglycan-binding protein [Streptomyces venezuelae]
MARWKELPAALDSREGRLIAELRRLKDHSGLSLAALAGKTGYSRSSWERYLNGKQPVPREAVRELAEVCGLEPTRLLVLHDVAAQVRRPGGTGAPRTEAPGTEAPRAERGEDSAPQRTVSLRGCIAGIVAAVVVAFTAGLLAGGVWGGDEAVADNGKAGYRRGVAYSCDIRRHGEELRAGHSTSRDILLDINSTGFDVVEVQCLLREHGFDPGSTDGLYGQPTKDAATRFQKARGLVADGIVGPKTWGELRR